MKLVSKGKSILRYPGGKTRGTKHILPLLMAQNATRLISPFFGGGSLEFAWAAECPHGRVHGVDLYEPVVCFWQHALLMPELLSNRVEAEFPLSKERFYELQSALPSLKNLELATAFYVLNRASFSGATMSGGMSPGHKRFTQSSIDRLRVFRAPNVSVISADAMVCLEGLSHKDRSDTVIYLDPPYKIDDAALYGRQGSMHRGFNHEQLAEILTRLSDDGWRWLLSYNASNDIESLYSAFRRRPVAWAYGMKNVSSQTMGKSSEVLIASDEFEGFEEVIES